MKTKVKYFTFPLCVLALELALKEMKLVAQSILYYWIYKRSSEITECCPNLCHLPQMPRDLDAIIKNKDDDRIAYEEAIKIVSASITEDIPVTSIEDVKKQFCLVDSLINFFVKHTNSQPYCRISRDLLLQMSRGNFDGDLFRILCAVKAIIGSKKPAMRITYDRICYAMYGYKSKDAYDIISLSDDKLCDRRVETMTRRMLRSRIKKLTAMKFFVTFTYNRKAVYYSTRFNMKKDLVNWLMNKKVYQRKCELGIDDSAGSLFVKNSIEEVEEGYRSIIGAPDSKEQLKIMFSF
ncbi:MAG: hypothetical protein Q8933_20200 [Bacteroidota bacterium]|nr:hypothetical protein [Bacteroidota bacterium]MDP4197562.1 hypothetical protein [Bacteroidota bacterium]